MEIVIEGFRFTSNFDSGNLAKVELIPKDTSKSGRPLSSRIVLDALNPLPVPDYRFNIWTLPDCAGTPFENLNRSWFHFGIQSSNAECVVQFTMKNLNKHTRLYSHGMAPVYCVTPGNLNYERIPYQPSYWVEEGQFYMSFVHILPADSKITTYFAFTYPYSYEKLQQYLQSIDEKFADYSDVSCNSPKDHIYYHRELVCNSLEGRRVDLITVTSCHGIMDEREPYLPCLFPMGLLRPHRFQNKRVVFLSARVHPGETPSSYVLSGFLDFILRDDDKRAAKLRKMYIFKLIPMLNPDGVAKGHYRTDTRGVNLNRVYKDPIFEYHPSIFAVKALILYYHVACRVQFRAGASRSAILHRNHSWSANTKKNSESSRGSSKFSSNTGVKKSKSSISHTALLDKHSNDESMSRKSTNRVSQRSLPCKNSNPVTIIVDNANSSQCKFWNPTNNNSDMSGVFIQPTENPNVEVNLSKSFDLTPSNLPSENIKAKSTSSIATPSEIAIQERNATAQVCRDMKISSVAIPFIASHLSTSCTDSSPQAHKETKNMMIFPSDIGDTKISPALTDRDKFLTFSSDWNLFVENIIQIRTELIETLRELRETMTTSLTKTLSNTSAWSTTTDDNSSSPRSPHIPTAHSASFFPPGNDVNGSEDMNTDRGLSTGFASENMSSHKDNHSSSSSWNSQEAMKAENPTSDEQSMLSNNEVLPKVMFGTHLLIPEFSMTISPQNSGIAYYIDMHGHASKRGCFIYGNYFSDIDDKIECMLFPKVLSINCGCFDFSACNFSHKNMYSTDKRDGTSKEGSGRVAIHKMTRIIRSYTLECNYNTGQFGRISPKPGPVVSVGTNPIPLHVMYKPEVYQQVGRSIALTMLDIEGIPNTGTKLSMSDYKVLQGVREWLRHHIKANESPTNNANFQCRSKNPLSQSKGGSSKSSWTKKLFRHRLMPRTPMAVKSGQGFLCRANSNFDPEITAVKWIELQPDLKSPSLRSSKSIDSRGLENCEPHSYSKKKSCRKVCSEGSLGANSQIGILYKHGPCSPVEETNFVNAWWLIPMTELQIVPEKQHGHGIEIFASSKPKKYKKVSKSKKHHFCNATYIKRECL